MKVFIGYDKRQPVAFQVLAHSIWKRASKPVSITRLSLDAMPVKRRGLTEFTFSRYLVPCMADYQGVAVFLDADMLCLTDICGLENQIDMRNAVSVVKNKLRFEWPSLMVFNCAHFHSRRLTPQYVEKETPQTLSWAEDRIGELDKNWNHIVPYDGKNPEAKIVHFTQGIPVWPETRDCEYSVEWNKEAWETTSSVGWHELMGGSVHARHMASLR